MEKATFGGGCFWCTEAIFKRLKGVATVTSGYTGGMSEKPTYDMVSSGQTGHAEAIQLDFNPQQISFQMLLAIFWATHDPTSLNQQGADVGTQYRSVIFYHTEEQRVLAEKSKMELEKKHTYTKPIVTEILPFSVFYSAEDYHQNYYDTNPTNQYCSLVIDPKIKKLLHEFNDSVKEEYK